MKESTEKRKNEILKKYTRAELKRRFAARTDDELFALVGASETDIREQPDFPEHLLVWRGYEILTDSPFYDEF